MRVPEGMHLCICKKCSKKVWQDQGQVEHSGCLWKREETVSKHMRADRLAVEQVAVSTVLLAVVSEARPPPQGSLPIRPPDIVRHDTNMVSMIRITSSSRAGDRIPHSPRRPTPEQEGNTMKQQRRRPDRQMKRSQTLLRSRRYVNGCAYQTSSLTQTILTACLQNTLRHSLWYSVVPGRSSQIDPRVPCAGLLRINTS